MIFLRSFSFRFEFFFYFSWTTRKEIKILLFYSFLFLTSSSLLSVFIDNPKRNFLFYPKRWFHWSVNCWLTRDSLFIFPDNAEWFFFSQSEELFFSFLLFDLSIFLLSSCGRELMFFLFQLASKQARIQLFDDEACNFFFSCNFWFL